MRVPAYNLLHFLRKLLQLLHLQKIHDLVQLAIDLRQLYLLLTLAQHRLEYDSFVFDFLALLFDRCTPVAA